VTIGETKQTVIAVFELYWVPSVGPGEAGAEGSYEQHNGWSESSNRADVAADVASSERVSFV